MIKTLRLSDFPAIVFSLTFFFFGVLHVYCYNQTDIKNLLPAEAALIAALLAISVMATIIVLSRLLNPRGERILALTLLSLTIALCVQGNLLLCDYGTINGSAIRWSSFGIYKFIDLGSWFVIIALVFVFSSFFLRHIKSICVSILLIQLICTGINFAQLNTPGYLEYVEDESQNFNFSGDNNVIVIVLDTFRTDIFKKVTEDDYFRRIFDGFLYFPDAVSGYPTTVSAVSYLLTGQRYENDILFHQYQARAYCSDSLPRILHENGYHVTGRPSMACDDFMPQNVHMKGFMSGVTSSSIVTLLELAGCRYLPQPAKQYFYRKLNQTLFLSNDTDEGNRTGEESRHRDLRFLDSFLKEARTEVNSPAFKFYHLFGLHRAFRLNKNLEYEELPQNTYGAVQQARAELKIVGKLLVKLKELGIFDSSIIWVVADHGDMTFGMATPVESENLEYLSPLVLFKPKGSGGPIQIVDTPVSLGDIPKTTFSYLGLDAEAPGISMLDSNISPDRLRRFFSYDWWGRDDTALNYLPVMSEFHIQGNSWDWNSWTRTPYRYTPGIGKERDDKVQFLASFTLGGNGGDFLLDGWSKPDKNYTLATAKTALIRLPLSLPHRLIKSLGLETVKLQIQLSPVIDRPEHLPQQLSLKINGKHFNKWRIDGPDVIVINFPISSLKSGNVVELEFQMPEAMPYNFYGDNNLATYVSIGISSIYISYKQGQ